MADEVFRNALPAGHVIEGYRVNSVLGAGGFGITYQATELSIGRLVAIKEFFPSGIAVRDTDSQSVHPDSDRSADDFEYGLGRFADEAKTLVMLEHPSIVPVLRFFEANGSAYMVMAYQDGMSLAELLRRRATLGERETLGIIHPLLDGLESVHAAGFTHRDVKPANIMIRANGQPMLIDFGSARVALGDRTRTIMYSVGYAPPEQYDSLGDQQAWTDIYALSATIYHCLTGAAPPDAMSRASATMRNRSDPMLTFEKAAKHAVSQALAEAVTAGLSVIETDRPRSITAFRELIALDGAVEKDPKPEVEVEPAAPSPELEDTISGEEASSSSNIPPADLDDVDSWNQRFHHRPGGGSLRFPPPLVPGLRRKPHSPDPHEGSDKVPAPSFVFAYVIAGLVVVGFIGIEMYRKSVEESEAAARLAAMKIYPAVGQCLSIRIRRDERDTVWLKITGMVTAIAPNSEQGEIATLEILTLKTESGATFYKSVNGETIKSGVTVPILSKDAKAAGKLIECPS